MFMQFIFCSDNVSKKIIEHFRLKETMQIVPSSEHER